MPTYRFRRREVMPIRVTWLGQVALALTLIHQAVFRTLLPGAPVGTRVLAFALGVLLPTLLLALWRAGLLPPVREVVFAPGERDRMDPENLPDERSSP